MDSKLIEALKLHYDNVETSRWIIDSEGRTGIEYNINGQWVQLIAFVK